MPTLLTYLLLALCAGGFAVLAVGLRPGTLEPGAPRLRLRIAAFATVLWAVGAGVLPGIDQLDSQIAGQLASLALVGIWIWQLEPYARWQSLPNALCVSLRLAGLVVTTLVLLWHLASARSAVVSGPSLELVGFLGIALCTFGLFGLEQIYRNASMEVRPAIRWMGLGIGGILATELLMFAETLLSGRSMLPPVAFRGLAFALCAGAILRGAQRMPRWAIGVAVSRQVALHLGSLSLVGGYLVLMALAAWALVSFAHGWNATARFSFGILAATGLGAALFLQGALQRLKVTISSHFYPHRYDYRNEWLRLTRTMSNADPSVAVPQRALLALAQMADSRAGRLWRTEQGSSAYTLVAVWPEDSTATLDSCVRLASQDPLPEFLQRTGWLIDLLELEREPEIYKGLQLDPAAYGFSRDALIIPLMHVDVLYGWIVLERGQDVGALDFEDRDLLKIAGRQVAAHLAQYDADQRLAEAHQFETYTRTTAFVMHDLKNIAAQLRLVSQNAERHLHNPEFVEDGFRTVAMAAQRMSKLIGQLTGTRESGALQTLDLTTIAERVAVRCSDRSPRPLVRAAARPAVHCDPEHLSAVIEHAVRNAQDATPDTGEVRIEVGFQDEQACLTVADTGCGMDTQFILERLFRPFDTTKGTRGMGIGAFQIREYLRSLGGNVQVQSAPGQGTRFALIFAAPDHQSAGLRAL